MVDIVNIVALGDIDLEFDLGTYFTEIGTFEARHQPEPILSLLIRSEEEGPVVVVFAGGSYTLIFVTIPEELGNLYNHFMTRLSELGIVIPTERSDPILQNLICKGHLAKVVDLEALPDD